MLNSSEDELDKQLTHRFTPFSIVSSTSVDASCTYVLLLADEKPEIADDSEIEDCLEWSSRDEPARKPEYFRCFCFTI